MYLSNHNKFAFIAVPRTGSHSFTRALETQLVNTGLADSHGDQYIIKSINPILPLAQTPVKQITGFPTNPTDLKAFLEITAEAPRADKFPPSLRYYVMMHHVTPSHLIKAGLLTIDNISEYNLFGFVRDPIQRWLSHCFLSAGVTGDLVGYTLYSGENIVPPKFSDPVEFIKDFIRVKLQNHPYPPLIKPYMEDYFYHEGQLVATPYTNDRMLEILNQVVTAAGGSALTEMPEIRPLGSTIPTVCKGDINDWLPSDCVDALLTHLDRDIIFYNKVINNEL